MPGPPKRCCISAHNLEGSEQTLCSLVIFDCKYLHTRDWARYIQAQCLVWTPLCSSLQSNPASCIFPLTSDGPTAPCITQRCLSQIKQSCPAAISASGAGLALLFCLKAPGSREGPRRAGHGILGSIGAEMPCRTDIITRQHWASKFHLQEERRNKQTETKRKKKCYQNMIWPKILQRHVLERVNPSSFLPLKLNADHSRHKKGTGSAGC